MEKGSLEKEIKAVIESFINQEGIDARLGESDFMIAERFMDFVPANPQNRSMRQIINVIEEVQIESLHTWKQGYKPNVT